MRTIMGDEPSSALAESHLATLITEVGARAGMAPGAPAARRTQSATDAYTAIYAMRAGVEPTARDLLAHLLSQVLLDAAAARGAMRDDPAAPGLEQAYIGLLWELGNLATVFATVDAETHQCPDPGDEYAGEYQRLCAETGALISASQDAKPVWAMINHSWASHAAAGVRPP